MNLDVKIGDKVTELDGNVPAAILEVARVGERELRTTDGRRWLRRSGRGLLSWSREVRACKPGDEHAVRFYPLGQQRRDLVAKRDNSLRAADAAERNAADKRMAASEFDEHAIGCRKNAERLTELIAELDAQIAAIPAEPT